MMLAVFHYVKLASTEHSFFKHSLITMVCQLIIQGLKDRELARLGHYGAVLGSQTGSLCHFQAKNHKKPFSKGI